MSSARAMPVAACPHCGGTGWEKEEADGRVKHCRCFQGGKIERVLLEARIPPRYQHCSLDSYLPQNPSQKKAKADFVSFLGQYPLIDVGLLIVGPCGVGKTHLAVAALRHVILEKGDTGVFRDFRDLLREIQASWNPVSQASEIDVLRPVLEANLLVLDELGANKPTEWVRETVAFIINSRYNNRKLTIFTSNYLDAPADPGEAGAPPGAAVLREESLAERIGVRLRSRLYEMCKAIEIRGKDFRKEFGQAEYRF